MTITELAVLVNQAAKISPDREVVISVDGREWEIKEFFGPWAEHALENSKYEIQARIGPYTKNLGDSPRTLLRKSPEDQPRLAVFISDEMRKMPTGCYPLPSETGQDPKP